VKDTELGLQVYLTHLPSERLPLPDTKKENRTMPKKSHIALTLLVIIVITLSFAGGCLFGTTRTTTSDNLTLERRAAISEVWDIIFKDYVDPSRLDSANMSQAAIEGMLKVLDDPYTSYLDPQEYVIGQSALQGNYTGIGAYVTVTDNEITVIAPIADSPADKAGIKAGDVILEIDGQSTADMSLAEAIIKVRGPVGTPVTLTVLHKGDTEPMEIEIVRASFDVPSVNFEMKGEMAYIKITDFNENTAGELATVIQNLGEEKAKGIILDLRGNPGGILNTVIDVASSFLSDGIVVQVRSNQGDITTYSVIKDRPKTELPMVVLVDGNSASGSEVLSGALQDHGRATIAGTTTYGKGSVDALYPLSDGSGLYITIARWLTPNGRLIEGQGIVPDITLTQTGDDEIQWAIDYLAAGEQ
jgi:carboxyl-terminal processing protease